MNKAAVFLYVKSYQDGMKISHVVQDIVKMEGVIQASANDKIEKMVNLTFDPQKTSCSHIVDTLLKQGCGSCVVGL